MSELVEGWPACQENARLVAMWTLRHFVARARKTGYENFVTKSKNRLSSNRSIPSIPQNAYSVHTISSIEGEALYWFFTSLSLDGGKTAATIDCISSGNKAITHQASQPASQPAHSHQLQEEQGVRE